MEISNEQQSGHLLIQLIQLQIHNRSDDVNNNPNHGCEKRDCIGDSVHQITKESLCLLPAFVVRFFSTTGPRSSQRDTEGNLKMFLRSPRLLCVLCVQTFSHRKERKEDTKCAIYFATTSFAICATEPVCSLIKYIPLAKLLTSKFLRLSPGLTESVFCRTIAPV